MRNWWSRFCLVVLGIVMVSSSALAVSATVVISQIYSGEKLGVPGSPRARNDFIELFNRGDATINLTGWTVQVAPPEPTGSWAAIPLSGSIAPGQYYLVRAALRQGPAVLPMADAGGDVTVQASGGRVAVVENSTIIGSICPGTVALDFVSYGSSTCGRQAEALDSISALVRAGGGCVDRDGGDFALVPAYPRTSSSPRNPCSTTPASRSFSTPANGGMSLQTTGAGASLGVGHIRIQPSRGNATPAGLAIFSFRQGQTLLSEASVPAAPLIQSGQLYVEANGPINTGIAIANPNDEDVDIQFLLVDAGRGGVPTQTGNITIPANGQIARFINELPYSLTTPVQGTFVFLASAPVAVIALRGYTNERAEFLVTTLPVIDNSARVSRDPSYLAHFAVSGGWRTEIVLIGATDETATGTIEFRDAAGRTVNVRVGTETGTSFPYSLSNRNSVKLVVNGATGDLLTGSVRIVPANGTPTPAAVAIFSYTRNNVRVSEAGLVSVRGNRFRTYVEFSGALQAAGSVQPGFALANTGTDPATVDLELTRLDGTSTGLRTSVSVPASGQVAKFLNEVFPTVAAPFQGILRVTTTSSIALIGLRGRYNERGDFLITTVPAADETIPASSAEFAFPHVADSGGYTTQIILFGSAGQASSGNLRLLTSGAQALSLQFQ